MHYAITTPRGHADCPLASTESNEVICRRKRRDTVPAAFHYFSKTGEDSRGLQGTGEDNELTRNPLPSFGLTTKVAHCRTFPKRAAQGSIPVASTNEPESLQ